MKGPARKSYANGARYSEQREARKSTFEVTEVVEATVAVNPVSFPVIAKKTYAIGARYLEQLATSKKISDATDFTSSFNEVPEIAETEVVDITVAVNPVSSPVVVKKTYAVGARYLEQLMTSKKSSESTDIAPNSNKAPEASPLLTAGKFSLLRPFYI